MTRLKENYQKRITKTLMKKFDYHNIHQVPKLKKITLNVGCGEALTDGSYLEYVKKEISQITGQMPTITQAKKAISNFRIRKGVPIGCKATLTGERMYEFFDRFVNFAAPRIRDFRGFSPDSFDGHGNYSLGLTEQIIFPEIDHASVKKIFGMNITMVTTAQYDDEAKALLEELGMPFRREI